MPHPIPCAPRASPTHLSCLPLHAHASLPSFPSCQVLVERTGPPARMPTKHGRFVAYTYRSRVDGTEHIALVKARHDPAHAAAEAGAGDLRLKPKGGAAGSTDAPSSGATMVDALDLESEYAQRPFAGSEKAALVRVHSECCTGDVFGSMRCDCGVQLESALQEIEEDGWGVLLYLRGQEGRGIGLGAKMHAYALQERGVDTLDANLKLGLPIDSREYGTGAQVGRAPPPSQSATSTSTAPDLHSPRIGSALLSRPPLLTTNPNRPGRSAQILADLGISDMRLMTNNPKKVTGITGYGLRIVERVPSLSAPNPENLQYMQTKRDRMGHMYTVDLDGEGLTDGVGVEDSSMARADAKPQRDSGAGAEPQ